MAVLMTYTFPEGVPREFIEEVSAEMNTHSDPPTGLVIHTLTEQDGRQQVVDVWESQDAHSRFAETRLMPAMEAVAKRHGIHLDDLTHAQAEFRPIYDVILGTVRTTA
jgi:hypothetical protein